MKIMENLKRWTTIDVDDHGIITWRKNDKLLI